MEFAEMCRVEWDEDVGHNAAAAVDSPAKYQGFEFERVREIDAVGILQLTVFLASDKFVLIFLYAVAVRFLDIPSTRSVISCNRQT